MPRTPGFRARRSRLLFIVGMALLCIPSLAGANPYNIAGYIAPVQLATFGFPAGVDTYDWNNLRPLNRYQMVRPMHYLYRYFVPGGNYVADWAVHDASAQPKEWFTQESYATSTPWNVRRGMYAILNNYWNYYLDRSGGNASGQIGMPPALLPQWYVDDHGTHQQQFANWLNANPGKIWLLGNEPGVPETVAGLQGQDALTAREYVAFYHAYHSTIAALDPTATFANAALAMTTSPSWCPGCEVGSILADWERVLGLYFDEYGIEMPIDIWNMHLYAGDGCQDEAAHRHKFVIAIETFKSFVSTTRGGHYAGRPLILTEFNGSYDVVFGQFTMANTVPFIEDFDADLRSLWLRRVLSEWFWFVSSGGGTWDYASILANSTTLTDVGVAYRDAAVEFESNPPVDDSSVPGYWRLR